MTGRALRKQPLCSNRVGERAVFPYSRAGRPSAHADIFPLGARVHKYRAYMINICPVPVRITNYTVIFLLSLPHLAVFPLCLLRLPLSTPHPYEP